MITMVNLSADYRAMAFLALVVLAAIGCDGGGIKRYPVSGQVLIDGEPLSHGTITVIPRGARPATSQLDASGRFTLVTSGVGEGVPAGNHAVEVKGQEFLGTYTVKWHAPVMYSKQGQSGLSIEVSQATDDCTVNLTWGGGKPFVQKYN